MKTTLFSRLFLLLFVLGLSFFPSCKKDKGPYKATITVVDKDNKPVSGAEVRVYCSSSKPCDVESKQTSDGSGNSVHEFKLPAVLKIMAKKTVTVTDSTGTPVTKTLIGEDYVKWEVDSKGNYDRDSQKTVTML
jgi:hypothetical protein